MVHRCGLSCERVQWYTDVDCLVRESSGTQMWTVSIESPVVHRCGLSCERIQWYTDVDCLVRESSGTQMWIVS